MCQIMVLKLSFYNGHLTAFSFDPQSKIGQVIKDNGYLKWTFVIEVGDWKSSKFDFTLLKQNLNQSVTQIIAFK